MITLQEYANKINELLAQGYGLLPVVYFYNDDDYNHCDTYCIVEHMPSEFTVNDITDYFLSKSSVQTKENTNCILIN